MSKEFEITIVVDTNDADYQTNVSEISQEELDKIRPLIEAISQFKKYDTKAGTINFGHHHNYPYGECSREDLGELPVRKLYKFDEDVFELFESLCPTNDYGFHTIKSVLICETRKKTKLL